MRLARENGAEVVIDYSVEGVPERVMEITKGEGVRVVFDGVGKSTFDGSLESCARKGSLISFGNASGAVPPVTIAYVVVLVFSLLFAALQAWFFRDVSWRY